MEKIGLKKEVLEDIRKNPLLFGMVAKAANLTPRSLNDLLVTKNHAKAAVRLASATVINALRNELNVQQDNELLEQIPNSSIAA